MHDYGCVPACVYVCVLRMSVDMLQMGKERMVSEEEAALKQCMGEEVKDDR